MANEFVIRAKIDTKSASFQLKELQREITKLAAEINKKEIHLGDIKAGKVLTDEIKAAKKQLDILVKEYAKKADEINKKEIHLGDIKSGKFRTDEMKKASKQVDDLGKQVNKKIDEINKKEIRLGGIKAGKVLTDDIKEAQKQVNKYQKEVDASAKKVEGLQKKYSDAASEKIPTPEFDLYTEYFNKISSRIKANGLEQGMAWSRAIAQGIAYSQTDIDNQVKEVNKALIFNKDLAPMYQERLNEMLDANASFESSSSELQRLKQEAEADKIALEEVRSSMQDLINENKAYTSGASTDKAKQIEEELKAESENLTNATNNLEAAKQNLASVTSKEVASFSQEIQQDKEGLSSLQEEANRASEAVDNAKNSAIESVSDEIQKGKDELSGLQKDIDTAKESVTNATENAVNSLTDEINQNKSELEGLQAEYSNLSGNLDRANSFNNFVDGAAKVGRALSTIAKGLWNIGVSAVTWIGKTAVNAVKTLAKVLISLSTHIGSFGIKAASVFGSGLLKGISKVKAASVSLGKAFLTVSEHLLGISAIKSVWSSITGLFNRIARLASLAFVFRVISQGLRQLKNDVVESFGTYLKYDSSLNSSINTLKTQFSTLKGQLASAFAPIISAIVPALSTLCNWAVTAANAVSALIAALTGRSSWKKAVVNSVGSVSDGASQAADDLGKATEAAEELEEKLGNYDKLNVIQDDKNKSKSGSGSGGSGGSGAGGSGSGISYEDVSIGEGIKNLADWLKDMWEKADLTDLGRTIGNWLKGALQKIPWENIQDEAKKTADRICTLIAGFVTTPGLGAEVGNAIGQLIQTGIVFANEMVHQFPWSDTGQFISDGLNAAVEAIDFGMAGDTISTGINGIVDALNAITDPDTGFDFGKFGDKIADFITNATNLNWDGLRTLAVNLGTGFGEFINSLTRANVLTSIGSTIGGFLSTAATLFTRFVNTVNFTDLGNDVGGFVAAIGDSIKDGLDELATIDVAGKLNEFFEGFKAQVTPEKLGEWGASLGTALGSAISGLATVIYDNRDWVYEAASSFISNLVGNAEGAITEEDFHNIGETLSEWTSKAIGDISDWFNDPAHLEALQNDLEGFLNGMADGWQPGTGGKLGTAIRNGLFIIKDTILQWFEEHWSGIQSEVEGFFDGLLGDGDGNLTADDFGKLGANLNSLLQDIATKITDWINDPNGLADVETKLVTFCEGLIGGDGDGVISKDEINTFITNVFDWVKESVGSIFQHAPIVAKLTTVLLLIKTGILPTIFSIGGKLALKFTGGITEGIGKNLTQKAVEDSVDRSTLESAGTTWGDWLGLAFGAAVLLKLGVAIGKELKDFDWSKGFFANTQDNSVEDQLDGWKEDLYTAFRKAGVLDGKDFFGDKKFSLANYINGSDIVDEEGRYGLTGLEAAFQYALDNIDTSQIGDLHDKLVDLRETGVIPAGKELDTLDTYIAITGRVANDQKEYINRFNSSLSEAQRTENMSKMSYQNIRDAVEDLGEKAGLSDEKVDALNYILSDSESSGMSAEAAYDRVVNELRDGSEEGGIFANVLENQVNEKLKNVASNINNIKVTDLNKQLDEMQRNGKLSADEVDRLKGYISGLPDGQQAFKGLIDGLSQSESNAGALKEVLANQLGVEVKDLDKNASLVKGTLTQLFNPDDTEAGKTKVNEILKMIGIDIDTIDQKEANPTVDVEDKASEKLDGVGQKLDETDQKEADPKVGLDTTEFDPKEANVGAAVTGLGEKAVNIPLNAEDNASEPVNNLKTDIDEVPSEKSISFVDAGAALLSTLVLLPLKLLVDSIGGEHKIEFTAENQTGEVIKAVKDDLTGVANHVKDTVNPSITTQFKEAFTTVAENAKAALIGGGQSILTHLSMLKQGFDTKLGEISEKVNTSFLGVYTTASGYLTGRQSIQNSIGDLVSNANTQLSTLSRYFSRYFQDMYRDANHSLSEIQAAINRLEGKKVDINVTDNGSAEEVDRTIDQSITKDYTVNIKIEWSGDTSKQFYASIQWDSVYTALGGIFMNGFWSRVPHYAAGTASAHGTAFVAGENGPEVVGHIGGRTEVLNKSQIAAAIYSSVKAAMGEGLTAAANATIQTIVNAANSINTNLGYLRDEIRYGSTNYGDLAYAGLGDVGALKSYYSNVIAPSRGYDLDSLANAVAGKISGNFYINNEMKLDGRVIYDEMVSIDRSEVRMTGRSGFGGD